MFTVLPFGNATVVGDMTGAQILEVLNYGPQRRRRHPAGRPQVQVLRLQGRQPRGRSPTRGAPSTSASSTRPPRPASRSTSNKTYKVGTNEFLAPAGGDGYNGFKYMTNITYWGDMLNAVNAYVAANYGTPATAYKGPNGDGTLDGRIVRDGTDAGGSIVPLTILHHNDSHGNLAKGSFVGYTQLATLIKQERLHNPTRTLLLSGGDNIQGDAMMYYFKSAPLGYAADGTPLPAALQTQPMMAAHERDELRRDGRSATTSSTSAATIFKGGPRAGRRSRSCGANVTDTGAYGLARSARRRGRPAVRREDRRRRHQGRDPRASRNHRVPNYELPSNIPGLTFSDPLAKAQELVRPAPAPQRRRHRPDPHRLHREPEERRGRQERRHQHGGRRSPGSTPSSAPQPHQPGHRVRRLQVPARRSSPVRTATPVIINQAYRYNNTLGEIVLGLRAKAGGGYEVVSRDRPLPVRCATATAEDAATKAHRRPVRGRAGHLQQQGRRPDHRPDRHPQGLHRGDQRRQPAGRRLGLGAGARTASRRRRPSLGRDDQQAHGRRRHRGQLRSRSRSPTCSPACPTRTRSSC